MIWLKRAVMLIALIAIAAAASADQWNERTKIKIDEPIMVPGATLAPGTYTFKLADSKTSRHVVQIWNEDETKLITTTNAVPAKRMDVAGDVVLKVNPTEAGASAPAAIKAWFYPGSSYGHEFVYPDHQARDIAQRTKTLVLSTDVPGSDMEKGTIYTYDATGQRGTWVRDDQMIREWNTWSEEGRRASARMARPGTTGKTESTVPIVRSQQRGTDVRVGDLEQNPGKYVGQTISVTAEVDEVFGPRLFKIDEPNWADFDGEVLVYMPTPLAALVREEDRVTITGKLQMFMKTQLEPELGWLEPDPDVEVEFAKRPVLFASSVIGGNSNVALSISLDQKPRASEDRAVGTSGSSAASAKGEVTQLSTLADGDRDLVGRDVSLDNVKVVRAGKQKGFWIGSPDASVFVLPVNDAGKTSSPAVGQSVSIDGVVLQMPRRLRDRADALNDANDRIYVYATSIK
jgi:hypothetical protein